MMPIAVFYHGIVSLNGAFSWEAFAIVKEAMMALEYSGLLAAAQVVHTCFNGGLNEKLVANLLVSPKAIITMHGEDSFAENLTLVEIERFVKDHPGWLVLYFHAKGASHKQGSIGFNRENSWRTCMLTENVINWRRCVNDLQNGAEAVGCHWLRGLDDTQHYFAGNFWWARSDFLRTVPSIYNRERIKTSGIGAPESRFEAEVWLGNAPRLPIVLDYHPGHPLMLHQ